MHTRIPRLLGILAVTATVACGSVGSKSKDAGSKETAGDRDGSAGAGGGGATGGGGSGGGGSGAGGATGTGGSTSSGIVVRGTIGTLGPAPPATGTIRLVKPRISIPGPTICNTTTCLVSGGIVK
jgi:hypothetical protein